MSGKRPRPRKRDSFHEKRQEMLWAWTDEVCNNEEVPEVEIVSLLHENIPKYRLRADSLTQFGGYENQDWFIPSPALPLSDEDLKLSPDQIRETLNYFLLCSNRVSQMTKTYNDIEAVTRLLEEKEKDLELTARIGKELLSANGRLETRVNSLEGELRGAREVITQLRHDLHAKSELLQVLTNDTEESPRSPEAESAEVRVGALRRRTGALERENRALREEAARLAAGADCAELAERQLLRDIAHQLASANSEASALGTELISERDRCVELQHQLETSNARLAATERNYQQLTAEHEHTLRILEITKENQNALASELADAKERYAEVAAHLSELQEQLRALRRRGEPARGAAGLMPHVAAAAGLATSLQRELHSSVYSELSLDSGIGDSAHQSSMHKIFETVQCASRFSGSSGAGSEAPPPPPRLPPPRTLPREDDSYLGDVSDTDNDDLYPGGWGGSGVPGAPGAAELAAALKRLTPQEINGRRALLMASHASKRSSLAGGDVVDSVSESAVWGAGGAGGRWRAPTKLQIVKPMEGSLTLHTWAQLAKPTMSGLLEEQEGVGVRGARNSSVLGARLYRLSDVEEDDDMPRLPHSSHIYTFTNSTVLHPHDGSSCGSLAGSSAGSALSSLASSVLGSAWSSRRASAATSPTRSRRVSVAPPSVPATPARRYSPTATPANSPLLGSPEPSPPGTPSGAPRPPSLHALIAAGRRYLAAPAAEGGAPQASPSHLTLQTPGSLYTGLVHRSPMEQLTCLKRTLRSPAAERVEASPEPARAAGPPPMGVPAAAGSGALSASPPSAGGTLRRARAGARAARPRTDLGTVAAAPPPAAPAPTSAFGTLGTLLFGRKGGLL